jgi:hypothetical protein
MFANAVLASSAVDPLLCCAFIHVYLLVRAIRPGLSISCEQCYVDDGLELELQFDVFLDSPDLRLAH